MAVTTSGAPGVAGGRKQLARLVVFALAVLIRDLSYDTMYKAPAPWCGATHTCRCHRLQTAQAPCRAMLRRSLPFPAGTSAVCASRVRALTEWFPRAREPRGRRRICSL